MFDKINLAKDNIYKDWQRALEKKHLKAAMLMMKIGQIPNSAVIFWGFNIFWPLEQHGVAKQWGFHCEAELLSFVQYDPSHASEPLICPRSIYCWNMN